MLALSASFPYRLCPDAPFYVGRQFFGTLRRPATRIPTITLYTPPAKSVNNYFHWSDQLLRAVRTLDKNSAPAPLRASAKPTLFCAREVVLNRGVWWTTPPCLFPRCYSVLSAKSTEAKYLYRSPEITHISAKTTSAKLTQGLSENAATAAKNAATPERKLNKAKGIRKLL